MDWPWRRVKLCTAKLRLSCREETLVLSQETGVRFILGCVLFPRSTGKEMMKFVDMCMFRSRQTLQSTFHRGRCEPEKSLPFSGREVVDS